MVVSAGLASPVRPSPFLTNRRRSKKLLPCGQKLHRRKAASRREQHRERARQTTAEAQAVRVADDMRSHPPQQGQVRADQSERRRRHGQRRIRLCSRTGHRRRRNHGFWCRCNRCSSGRSIGRLLGLGAINQDAQTAIDRPFRSDRNRSRSTIGSQQVTEAAS